MNEIKRRQERKQFQERCEKVALELYEKRYADLTDSQCSKVSRIVAEGED